MRYESVAIQMKPIGQAFFRDSNHIYFCYLQCAINEMFKRKKD